jgi:cytoskeletal protein CcmA (bactofilin family)
VIFKIGKGTGEGDIRAASVDHQRTATIKGEVIADDVVVTAASWDGITAA